MAGEAPVAPDDPGIEIDWEALAKAAFGCEYGRTGDYLEELWANDAAGLRDKHDWEGMARAVVAALANQGLCVVRREDAALLVDAVKEAGKALADASEIDTSRGGNLPSRRSSARWNASPPSPRRGQRTPGKGRASDE